MKYLSILVVLAVIYFVLARHSPVASVKDAVVQSEVEPLIKGPKEVPTSPGTTLKRPLDRTQEVLGQVKTRNGEGEF